MVVYSNAVILLAVLPVVLNIASTNFGLNEAQKGFYSSLEYFALALGSTLSFLWIKRVDIRLAMLCLSGLLAAIYFISAVISDYNSLLVLRFLGSFIAGSLAALAVMIVGSSSNPDRFFGWIYVLNMSLALLVSTGVPRLVSIFGYEASYASLGIISLVIIPFTFLMQRFSRNEVEAKRSQRQNSDSATSGGDGRNVTLWAVVALVAVFLEAMSAGTFMAYIGSLARASDLTDIQVGDVIGLASILGFFACFIPVFIGAGFNRIVTLTIVVAIFIVGVAITVPGISYLQYTIGICLHWIGGVAAVIYYLATAARVDKRGQFLSILAGVKMFGYSTGPFFTALFVNQFGLYTVHVVTISTLILSLVLLSLAVSKSKID